VPQLIESIRQAVNVKQLKIAALEQQKKNFGNELTG
jgi:hypothetical protein